MARADDRLMAENRSKRKWVPLAVAMALLFLVVPTVVLLKAKALQDTLGDRGVVTEAVVVGVERGDPDILWVRFEACPCRVAVATTNVRAHPVGSVLPVRYDPDRPSRAEALVDAPDPYEDVYGVGLAIVLSAVICVPLVALGLRRVRRARALVATTAPTGTVRVEAWERSLMHQPLPYLSVYALDAPSGTPPLVCFPLDPDKAEVVGEDDVFELFGSGRPGEPLALRRGEVVIVPSGKAQSAEWEARHRQPHSDLQPRLSSGRVAVIAPTVVLRDAREAQVYWGATRLVRWLYVLMLPVALLRLAPDHLLGPVLAAVFAYLGVLVAALGWQRHLLARLARRLPGPAPSGYAARRAARGAVVRHLATPPGRAELAGLLGTTAEDLVASDRRFVHRVVTSAVVTGLVLLAAIVRFAAA